MDAGKEFLRLTYYHALRLSFTHFQSIVLIRIASFGSSFSPMFSASIDVFIINYLAISKQISTLKVGRMNRKTERTEVQQKKTNQIKMSQLKAIVAEKGSHILHPLPAIDAVVFGGHQGGKDHKKIDRRTNNHAIGLSF